MIWEWEDWIRLTLPEDWTVEEDDGLVTMFHDENGVGSLQFSVAAYKNPPPDVEQHNIEILTGLAGDRSGDMESLRAFRAEGMDDAVATYAAFTTGDDFWEAWVISDGRQRLMFTYNCALEHRGKERDQYGSILQSAHFLWIGGHRLLGQPWYWMEA